MPAQLTAALSGTPTVAAASTAACTEASSDTSMRANTPPISPATRFPPSSFRSATTTRSEEHTSELQSLRHLVCRLLLEKNNIKTTNQDHMHTSLHTSILYCTRGV